jgi:hypothetical protein
LPLQLGTISSSFSGRIKITADAALEAPDLLVGDVRAFFRRFR